MATVKLQMSVRGASHKPNGECQDANLIESLNNGMTIAAVADGHGSPKCKYSRQGAECAVRAFAGTIKLLLKSIENQYGDNSSIDMFINLLHQYDAKKFVALIHEGWKDGVRKQYKKIKKSGKEQGNPNEIDYELFGTTLLGLVIHPEFVFAVQIGDGDIVCVDNAGVKHLIEPDKFLGTETYSLSNDKPWKHAIIRLQRLSIKDSVPYLFMMFSDGFSNSFVDDEQFKIACKDYFEIIGQYGPEAVQNNLEEWLDDTSTKGCGDDITLVAVGDIDINPDTNNQENDNHSVEQLL